MAKEFQCQFQSCSASSIQQEAWWLQSSTPIKQWGAASTTVHRLLTLQGLFALLTWRTMEILLIFGCPPKLDHIFHICHLIHHIPNPILAILSKVVSWSPRFSQFLSPKCCSWPPSHTEVEQIYRAIVKLVDLLHLHVTTKVTPNSVIELLYAGNIQAGMHMEVQLQISPAHSLKYTTEWSFHTVSRCKIRASASKPCHTALYIKIWQSTGNHGPLSLFLDR